MAKTPKFLFLHQYKTVLQYRIKTHLGGSPMPKFEVNMNYIPTSLPSSMKQCNKSATVKFHMELLLTTKTRKQSFSGAPQYGCIEKKNFVQQKKIFLIKYRHCTAHFLFSSPEHKVLMVSFCDRPMSGIRHASSTISLNIFSS